MHGCRPDSFPPGSLVELGLDPVFARAPSDDRMQSRWVSPTPDTESSVLRTEGGGCDGSG
jgi:hypothetical protein